MKQVSDHIIELQLTQNEIGDAGAVALVNALRYCIVDMVSLSLVLRGEGVVVLVRCLTSFDGWCIRCT
jgi:hypothetical protein